MEKICPIMSTEYRDGKCVQCMREVCGLWDNVGECCGLCFRHGPTAAKQREREMHEKLEERKQHRRAIINSALNLAESGRVSVAEIAHYSGCSMRRIHEWLKTMSDEYQVEYGMVSRKRDSDD